MLEKLYVRIGKIVGAKRPFVMVKCSLTMAMYGIITYVFVGRSRVCPYDVGAFPLRDHFDGH